MCGGLIKGNARCNLQLAALQSGAPTLWFNMSGVVRVAGCAIVICGLVTNCVEGCEGDLGCSALLFAGPGSVRI